MKKTCQFLVGVTFALAALPQLAFSQPPSYSQPSYGHTNQGMQNSFGQINWLRNYNEAVAQAQASGKSIVLLFTGTSWCPACMKLEREVLNHPEFAQALGNRFIFLKAEFPEYGEEAVHASPYGSLLDRYGVDSFPTMVIINPNGQQLFTLGYQAGGPGFYINQLLQRIGQQQSQPNFHGRPMQHDFQGQPSFDYR